MDPEDAGKLLNEEKRPLNKPSRGKWIIGVSAAAIIIFVIALWPDYLDNKGSGEKETAKEIPSIAVLPFDNFYI